ncbi:GntR family transcriptional regulator [Paracoccaceae bacterium]|jgi:DNA-binding GntR family transcriptional regulator|nr:GntR family transcriptional regulator [Paracoccaceae bacterium]|tara:strand:+ start:3146 stop:3805 length:660 start_codon:yes stop_codon:yes gene_type:complete
MALSEIRPLTLSVQVRDMLRDQIMAGELSPGERLTEIDLSRRLKVSRGPLREAILQLTEEGLLVKKTYKGLRVRSISLRELEELYSMRTTLERFAFKKAWGKKTDAALEDLRARFDYLEQSRNAQDISAAVNGEIHFHSWVYELSNHSLLQSHWRKLVPLVRIYMSIHNRQHGVCGVFMDANYTYLNLAQGDDLAAVLLHIKDHMQKGLDEVYASLEVF